MCELPLEAQQMKISTDSRFFPIISVIRLKKVWDHGILDMKKGMNNFTSLQENCQKKTIGKCGIEAE